MRALRHSGGLDVARRRCCGALGREQARPRLDDRQRRARVGVQPHDRDQPPAPTATRRSAFAAAVREAKITDRRLRELACYAPQWAAHVEATLGVPASPTPSGGCTRTPRTTAGRRGRAQGRVGALGRRAHGARGRAARGRRGRRPLVRGGPRAARRRGRSRSWSTRPQVRLHRRRPQARRAVRRARCAATSTTTSCSQRIEAKRHQDTVRALGLLPLPDGDEPRARRSPGATRRCSSSAARAASSASSARQARAGRPTSGSRTSPAPPASPTRPGSAWAMEAAATADLAGDGAVVEHDDVRVALRVDADGKPEVAVRRGEKALKSVPAKLRKVPEIKALHARATELRRQGSRIRASLEQAMVRGDALTGDELARYREHALLWPALTRLVLVGEGDLGYPDGDGRVLRDHAGAQHAVGKTERLRIAHPLDLLERGDWPAWQHDVLSSAASCSRSSRCSASSTCRSTPSARDAAGSRRYAGHQVQPGSARALLGGRGWRDRPRRRAAAHRSTHEHVDRHAVVPQRLRHARPTSSRRRSKRSASRSTRDGRDLPLADVPPRRVQRGDARPRPRRQRRPRRAASTRRRAPPPRDARRARGRDLRAAELRQRHASTAAARPDRRRARALLASTWAAPACTAARRRGLHRARPGQQRGRLFLPFADDDPQTAEVVAKVLLLARDRDIRTRASSSSCARMSHETVFTLEATPIKFGPGAAADAGWELKRLGRGARAARDRPGRRGHGPSRPRARVDRGRGHRGRRLRPRAGGADARLAAGTPPTPRSRPKVDGFVSVGGGSAMDTAKVANLIVTHPAPVMDYVNPPIGEGRKPPAPLQPHLAIPTTSGTGSEATTVAVLDIPDLKVKTGISHRYLRPTPGDRRPRADAHAGRRGDLSAPGWTSSATPPSRTSPSRSTPGRGPRPPTTARPTRAPTRSPTCGRRRRSSTAARYLRRAVADAEDVEARGRMMLAASMAGVGFGSAGVHIPHACAYPIAGLKHDYQPPGYPDDHPFVPARALGDRHRARRVPLHLRRRPGAPPPRRRAARRRADRGPRARTRCPRCCAR